ncbi:MAG: (d)CMP kinase [Pseudomonadota bacterium]
MSGALVIAIDGPAASGKGTIAKRLAARFALPHLDTGLLYRATAAAALAEGAALEDAAAAARAAAALTPAALEDPGLRSAAMSAAASIVAAHADVRATLLQLQRDFASQPGGAVLDGRDIGSVVCPAAPAKLFVTASAAVRAARRARELAGRGEPADLAAIEQDLITRDRRDRERSASPLTQATDAHLLDTTDLDIDQAVEAAARYVAEAAAATGEG